MSNYKGFSGSGGPLRFVSENTFWDSMESKDSDWGSIESKESEIHRADKDSSLRFVELTRTLETPLQNVKYYEVS